MFKLSTKMAASFSRSLTTRSHSLALARTRFHSLAHNHTHTCGCVPVSHTHTHTHTLPGSRPSAASFSSARESDEDDDTEGEPLVQYDRPRRNRKSKAARAFCQETFLTPQHFVYPLFIHAGSGTEKIDSMPGCERLDIDGLLKEAENAQKDNINTIALFPSIDEALKTRDARESCNSQGLVPKAIRALKREFPSLSIVTDVALDPYNSDGHDGLVLEGEILNDETVEILCAQALMHADAGADFIAPSDMMDGRIGAIREHLEDYGYTNTSIISYTAKYASAFYGPFRDALNSTPKAGDKKTYQMSPANTREALRELDLDEDEGADIIMVKPAGAYLDIISLIHENTNLPVAAYQVSGEYAMIKAASERGWLNEREVTMESLLAIRRAGAQMIFTYYARDAARWLKEGHTFY